MSGGSDPTDDADIPERKLTGINSIYRYNQKCKTTPPVMPFNTMLVPTVAL